MDLNVVGDYLLLQYLGTTNMWSKLSSWYTDLLLLVGWILVSVFPLFSCVFWAQLQFFLSFQLSSVCRLSCHVATCSHSDSYITAWHFHINWYCWKSLKSVYRLPLCSVHQPDAINLAIWGLLTFSSVLNIDNNLFIKGVEDVGSFVCWDKKNDGLTWTEIGVARKASHSCNGLWFTKNSNEDTYTSSLDFLY